MGNGRTEMNWHTQPQLSCIKMKLHPCGFPGKRLLWDLSLHIIQCSRVCCACTKCPKILHIGFIPYSNERNKAIKLSSYKNQIYLLYSAKCIDIATPLVPTEESYSRQHFCKIGFKVSDTCALSQISPIFMASSHSPNHYKSTFMGLYG